MRGSGWGKKHSVVDYVWRHPYYKLYLYHAYVINWMQYCGYKPDEIWLDEDYRGKTIGFDHSEFTNPCSAIIGGIIYPEHNREYLRECLENLKSKGIDINQNS
jgi:uncharacterized protein (TIGR02328 family)